MERWHLLDNKESIIWDSCFDGHHDYLEMSGQGASFIVTYGTDTKGCAEFSRHVVFPTLRLRPNETSSSYQCTIPSECLPRLSVNGESEETAVSFVIDGDLHATTRCGGARIERTFFPCTTLRACCEQIVLHNDGQTPLSVAFTNGGTVRAHSVKGCMAVNITYVLSDETAFVLSAGESHTLSVVYTGTTPVEPLPSVDVVIEAEQRRRRIAALKQPLQLETGTVLDTLFALSKIRAGESVFMTRNGPIHCPGGYAYYAAVWCNDQCEYSGPYFAFTGDDTLQEAAMNGYRWYIPFMDETYDRIPSSIIAEGLDYWDGAGDRGDAAMYLYGASYYCLIRGDREAAKELWPAIQWCAAYCHRQTTDQGIIASDSDELESRLPAGDANLCTSTLCLMGLRAAAELAREFGETALCAEYIQRADKLEAAIDAHFAADVEGYATYRYYEGNEVLRSWICMPLCAGLESRAKGTVEALLGPRLWHENGVLSQSGEDIYWDRSTLYALRGIYKVGYPEKAAPFLLRYCRARLFGDRVPYAIEAYPEGNKRHLSAESALLAQIVLLGILGITPKGFTTFEISPQLSEEIPSVTLKHIHAFGTTFDITANATGWSISYDGKELHGSGTQTVTLA